MLGKVTRSNSAAAVVADDKTLSAELKAYFEKLLSKHTELILNRVETLEKRLQEKDRVIEDLEERLKDVEEVEARVAKMEENVFVAIDDAEQYGRRMNIRLENIPYQQDETNGSLLTKIESALDECGVDVSDGMLVRWHRSGKPYKIQQDGTETLVAQTILKFTHWNARKQAHGSKKKIKDDDLPYVVRQDLTKRRYSLMKDANSRLKQFNRKDLFAFADINCNLVIRNGKKLTYFNTIEQFEDIVALLD